MREFQVHPTEGDNRATGLPGDPVRRLSELVRRFGQIFTPYEDTIITMLGPTREQVSWWVDVSHALLTIRAALPTASYSGLVATPVARDAASPYNSICSGWSVPSEVGKLLVHGPTGRSSWIGKDLTGGAARLCPWWRAPVDVGNVAHGDPFTSHTLHTIAGLNINAFGGWLEGGTTGLVLRDLDFVDPGGGRRSTINACANVIFERCKFTHLPQINGGQHQLRGCYVPPDDLAGVNYFMGNLAPVNVVLAACLSRLKLELGTSVGGSVIAPSFGTLIQGGGVALGNGFDLHSGGILRVVDMSIADSPGHGIENKYGGAMVIGGPLRGDGNGGYGYYGNASTEAVWFDASLASASLTGALGDYWAGSPGTWATLLAGGGRYLDVTTGAYVGKN